MMRERERREKESSSCDFYARRFPSSSMGWFGRGPFCQEMLRMFACLQ